MNDVPHKQLYFLSPVPVHRPCLMRPTHQTPSICINSEAAACLLSETLSYPFLLMTSRTLVIVNTTGRQGASLARVATAVGYNVRAHIHTKLSEKDGQVAKELQELKNIELIEGSLEDPDLVSTLFVGARKAFINTISWGDEVAIGNALADAAKKAGVQHYIYSSMPDHGVFGRGWPSLPLWSCKFTVENYIRQVWVYIPALNTRRHEYR